MKNIYFIRHAESTSNVGAYYSTPEDPLTEVGREQALFVAERFSKIPIDIILCSSMQRAKETGLIISGKIQKPLNMSDLLRERRRSTEISGQRKDNDTAATAVEVIYKNFHQDDFRFSNEENFTDLKERAGEALSLLASLPEKNVLVITHGFFLKILMAYMVFGEKLTGEECIKIARTFSSTNTGLSLVDYEKEREESWKIRTWNDRVHLG